MNTNYIKYQCTICRRLKDVADSPTYAFIASCTITEGCTGRLLKIGETSTPSRTEPAQGLVDWRKTSISTPQSLVKEVQSVPIYTGPNGTITIAILSDFETVDFHDLITVVFKERSTESVQFDQYTYISKGNVRGFTGRDNLGKTMRFSSLAISEDRVYVEVNGVEQKYDGASFSFGINKITFTTAPAAGSKITVKVYAKKLTIDRKILFQSHDSYTPGDMINSWSNIRSLNNDPVTQEEIPNGNKWWLYSSIGLGSINLSARLRLDRIMDSDETLVLVEDPSNSTMMLIGASPYEMYDRYQNFIVDGSALVGDFFIQTAASTPVRFQIAEDLLTELYPGIILKPFGLTDSPFMMADVISLSSASSTDTNQVRLQGTKILGPI